jgi:hypothetical protein
MRPNPTEMSETVVPFSPTEREGFSNDDPLDKAGHTVMGLLQQAAGTAAHNCQQALDVAHKLSLQLRAAEDQLKALEAEVRHYQDRAKRAEQWLLRIAEEIGEKFLDLNGSRSRQAPTRQDGPYSRNV